MSDFIERLQIEKNELGAKQHKLRLFMVSDKFAEISKTQQELMYMQRSAMAKYYGALDLRLYDLEQNTNK